MDSRATHAEASQGTAAFAAFYDNSVRELFRYFYRATAGDRRVAEDLVQETFIAVVKSLRDGHPDAITMPWLMGVSRHKLIDYYRRVARENRKVLLASSIGSRSLDESEFDAVDATEALELLEGLSASHRLVLLLRYVDDLAVSDVARLMDKTVSATESLIVRARHALEIRLTEVRSV